MTIERFGLKHLPAIYGRSIRAFSPRKDFGSETTIPLRKAMDPMIEIDPLFLAVKLGVNARCIKHMGIFADGINLKTLERFPIDYNSFEHVFINNEFGLNLAGRKSEYISLSAQQDFKNLILWRFGAEEKVLNSINIASVLKYYSGGSDEKSKQEEMALLAHAYLTSISGYSSFNDQPVSAYFGGKMLSRLVVGNGVGDLLPHFVRPYKDNIQMVACILAGYADDNPIKRDKTYVVNKAHELSTKPMSLIAAVANIEHQEQAEHPLAARIREMAEYTQCGSVQTNTEEKNALCLEMLESCKNERPGAYVMAMAAFKSLTDQISFINYAADNDPNLCAEEQIKQLLLSDKIK